MVRLHVHVIALRVPSPEAVSARPASDLLPWADPYVAALIRQVSAEIASGSGHVEVAEGPNDGCGDLLTEDAFYPPLDFPPPKPPHAASQPVIGGFPLLDEQSEATEAVRRPR